VLPSLVGTGFVWSELRHRCARPGYRSIPADRLLATRLGSACADLIHEGVFGVMVAARGDGTEPVPLEKVAGKRKTVPPNHPWVETARRVGTCFGD
jgi:6-phosphofructokinase 1